KLSAAYVLSDYEWWPAAVESFKLRAALGESGRAPGAFDAMRVWTPVAGDNGRPGVTPSNPGSPDLGPERTREVEYGFEGTAFENLLSFEFTTYKRRTYDALIAMNQVPSLGYGGTQLENVGELKAWGTEAMVSVRPIRTPSVAWEVGGRYGYTMTEAVDLGGLKQIAAFVPLWQQWIMPGQPIPVYYGPIVQNPNEVGVPPVYENQVLGGAYPPHTASFNTSLTLAQRLTFSGIGEFQGGHYRTNGTATQQVRRGLWPECMGIRERVIARDIAGLTARQQDRCQNQPPYIAWTERGDFFKLRQVSVSYRVPERFLQWAGARGGSVLLEGNNLLTITNYSGLDPEAIQGGSLEGSSGLYRVEYYQLPSARRFLLSVNLNF
ncbi:MAG: TonB-dependent receptor, partial [Longimicrobiales bacterium]|nr:TonB-dependent receptor [Longimicrobiales bacterium]